MKSLKEHKNLKKWFEASIFSFFLSLAIISQYLKAPSLDGDIFWSIAIGKWIALNHAFPAVDVFSWTIDGKEWMTHEWAYSFLAYYMSQNFGSAGLYFLAFIPVLVTAYFLYLIAKSYDKNRNFAYLLVYTLGVLLLFQLTLPFRAYIYAILFVTLLVYLLYFKTERRYDAILYVALFVFWSNFQVSVFIGLVILFAELMRQALIYPSKRFRALVIGVLCAASTLINPYGWKLWDYFAFMIGGMGESKYIIEWQAADFDKLWILLLYVGVAATVFIGQLWDARKHPSPIAPSSEKDTIVPDRGISLPNLHTRFVQSIERHLNRDSCLVIGFWCFYIYSLYSVRMFVFAFILWIIVMSCYAGKIRELDFTGRTYTLFIILLFLLGAANWASADFAVKDICTYDKKISPIEETVFLKENPTYGYQLFNEYNHGGYLILNDIPVFIDSRSDSYIKFGVQKKYFDITLLRQDPQAVLDEMGVKNLLISEGPFKKYIDINPEWRVVYAGPNATVYTRLIHKDRSRLTGLILLSSEL